MFFSTSLCVLQNSCSFSLCFFFVSLSPSCSLSPLSLWSKFFYQMDGGPPPGPGPQHGGRGGGQGGGGGGGGGGGADGGGGGGHDNQMQQHPLNSNKRGRRNFRGESWRGKRRKRGQKKGEKVETKRMVSSRAIESNREALENAGSPPLLFGMHLALLAPGRRETTSRGFSRAKNPGKRLTVSSPHWKNKKQNSQNPKQVAAAAVPAAEEVEAGAASASRPGPRPRPRTRPTTRTLS